jgi:hypothetical protein
MAGLKLSSKRRNSTRDANNESERFDGRLTGVAVAVAEHQRRSSGFKHSTGDGKLHPAHH